MRRSVHALAVAGALALMLSACASSKATGLPPGPTEGPTGGGLIVTMPGSLLKFVPDKLTVKVGDTVTWTNDGALPHTVTHEDQKTFDSDIIESGKEFKFTFKAIGAYPYYCKLHASRGARVGMIGEITVEAGTGSPSPSPST